MVAARQGVATVKPNRCTMMIDGDFGVGSYRLVYYQIVNC